jgi:hypothetical protein
MSTYKWLWISALMFFGASAASFCDYRNSIYGPSSFWDDASLVGVSARPIHAECRRFTAPGGYRGFGEQVLADPQLKFSYLYKGGEHLGVRYSRTRKYHSLKPDECSAMIQGFLASQSLTVWVDPKNPNYSVFKKDVPFPVIELSLLLIGGLVLAFAGFMKLANSRVQ